MYWVVIHMQIQPLVALVRCCAFLLTGSIYYYYHYFSLESSSLSIYVSLNETIDVETTNILQFTSGDRSK